MKPSASSAISHNLPDIPVLRPMLPTADCVVPYLRHIDSTRHYTNHGPLVCEFEARIAESLRVKPDCVASASSGTAAIAGAILASAGRATAEHPLALLPAFTFVGTAMAAEQCGYRPYLADIDPETWMLDPARIVNLPVLSHIGVVIPVAPFGRAVHQGPWREFQAQTGIPVVIDGAACYAEIRDKPQSFVGSIPIGLSFHATKSFSTGEGGGVVAVNPDLIQRVVMGLNFGCYGSREARSPGSNGKMSEYHAAVGLAEFDGWSQKRHGFETAADGYRDAAADLGLSDRFYLTPDIGMPYAIIRCRDPFEASHVQLALGEANVGWRLWYGTGLHHHSYFFNAQRGDLRTTDDVAPRLIGVPMAPDMTQAQVRHVTTVLAAAVRSKHAG
jgi:dTDP-4-amino-4,6-dideoxygalactose transaminase